MDIAIISNFDSQLRLILDRFQLSPHISSFLLSGEIGIEKPDRRIFDLAAKQFNLPSMKYILHIGDSYDKDYIAAQAAGANALLFMENPIENNDCHIIRSLSELIENKE